MAGREFDDQKSGGYFNQEQSEAPQLYTPFGEAVDTDPHRDSDSFGDTYEQKRLVKDSRAFRR